MPSASYFYTPAPVGGSSTPLGTFMAHNAPAAKPVTPFGTPGSPASGGPFTLNPTPTTGNGPYGQVPGPIAKPPSLYQGAQSIYPGLANLTDTSGRNIMSELRGEFSPETENALWDTANRFGVASGMPGAQLWSNRFMGNVAGAKEKLQQQGQQDYNSFLGNLAHTTDDPNLLASIAARNATMAAAPNPEAAALALAEAYRRAQLDAAGRARGPAAGTTNPYFNNSPAGGTIPRPNPFVTPATTPASVGWHDPFLANNQFNEDLSQFFPEYTDEFWNGFGGSPQGSFSAPPPNTFYNPTTDTSNYSPFGDPFGQLDNVATGNTDPYANMSDEDWLNYIGV